MRPKIFSDVDVTRMQSSDTMIDAIGAAIICVYRASFLLAAFLKNPRVAVSGGHVSLLGHDGAHAVRLDETPDEENEQQHQHQRGLPDDHLVVVFDGDKRQKQGDHPADRKANKPAAGDGVVARERVVDLRHLGRERIQHHVDAVTGGDSLDTAPDDGHGVSVEERPEPAIDAERRANNHGKRDLVHHAWSARHHHEKRDHNSSQDNTEPRLPPREPERDPRQGHCPRRDGGLFCKPE
ncbi:hypothetical protein KL944_003558 [Ogataea haglerorum]|nr:hypothetical protein KL944_003558 [Ogataea haglerorum]